MSCFASDMLYYNGMNRQMTPGMPMPNNTGTGMVPFTGTQMLPVLSTGQPAGPAMGGTAPVPVTGSTLGGAPIAPTTLENPAYIPGFLKSMVGQRVRVEFLIGTGTFTDRTGTLVGVGASYILLRLEETDDIQMCDLYSIKFVTFFR